MSKDKHKELAQLAKAPAQLLSLHEWDIDYKLDRLEDGYCGNCTFCTEGLTATITIDPDKSKAQKDLELTLIHELIHLRFAVAWDSADKMIKTLTDDRKMRSLIWALYTQSMESSIELTAKALIKSIHGLCQKK